MLCVGTPTLPQRISLMARSRYRIYDGAQPHFLTCTVVGWMPLFAHPPLAQIVLGALRFLQKEERLTLYAYVVMENHLHLTASAGDLSKEMGHFKSYTARAIIDELRKTGRQSALRELKRLKARTRTTARSSSGRKEATRSRSKANACCGRKSPIFTTIRCGAATWTSQRIGAIPAHGTTSGRPDCWMWTSPSDAASARSAAPMARADALLALFLRVISCRCSASARLRTFPRGAWERVGWSES